MGFGIFALFLWLGMIGFSIYCFILFIKLATRGIQALDIYIEKNKYNK